MCNAFLHEFLHPDIFLLPASICVLISFYILNQWYCTNGTVPLLHVMHDLIRFRFFPFICQPILAYATMKSPVSGLHFVVSHLPGLSWASKWWMAALSLSAQLTFIDTICFQGTQMTLFGHSCFILIGFMTLNGVTMHRALTQWVN